ERFSGHADARSDIYSLGATLYELLTRVPAFAETDRQQLIKRILDEEPIRPSAVDRQIPADLETIVLKAMAKDPSDRYSSAEAMADDLRQLLSDRPIRARRMSTGEKLKRWCRRNPVIAGAIAATLFILVAGIAGVSFFWRRAEHNATMWKN